MNRVFWSALACVALAGCGGGDANIEERLFDLRLSVQPGTVVVRPDKSATVRVDMPSVADRDLPSGYAIDLDEVVGRIDVQTASCPAGAGSRMCQDWTISPLPGAVPGTYTVNVRSVGSRAGTATSAFRLVVASDPLPNHGAAVKVSFRTGHVLVINETGRVFARGRNLFAAARSGYLRLSIEEPQTVVEPPHVDEFVETRLPSGNWVGIAAGAGNSFAVRDDGTVWAWGYNGDDDLGLRASAAGQEFVVEPRQVPGLADVRAITVGTISARGVVPTVLLADGRVRRWNQREGLMPYCELITPLGCEREVTDVRAIAGVAQELVLLKNDGSVWRAPHRPCNAGQCPSDQDWFHYGFGRVERLSGQLPPAVAVASTLANGIALAADGTVWQWARDDAPDAATQVAGLSEITVIAGHETEHPYALKRDGTVWTWNPDSPDPARQVLHIANVVAISQGHAITGDCSSTGGSLWRLDGTRVERLYGFGCAVPETRHVSVSLEGDGRVISSPPGIDCPGTCTGAFALQSQVTLHEAPARGWTAALRDTTFEERRAGLGSHVPDWRGDSGCTKFLVATTNLACQLRFIPGGDRRLEVRVVGAGRVTSTPQGIDCGDDCVQAFDVAAPVLLNAAPSLGYRFDRFSGDVDCNDGQLIMDAVRSCTARFVALPAPATPTGLAALPAVDHVRLSWDAVVGPVAEYLLERALSGSSEFAAIAVLAGDAANHIDSDVEPATTYMYRLTARTASGAGPPASVTATTLVPGPSLLMVTVNGNGSVSSDPPGIACGGDCTESFAYGAVVRLIAAPAADHNTGFSGDADCSDGIVTMTRPVACTVTFVPRSGSGWQQLGAALTDRSRIAPSYSLALDDNLFGAPIVAYVEALAPAEPARLFVKRLDGVIWTLLGAGALNAGSITSASDPSVATRLGSAPHVAWSQGNGVQQNVFVARFNGTAWESVGPPGIPLNYVAGSRAVRPSLALDANGRPQVAWIEDGAVKFKRFDGVDWLPATLGGEGPPSAAADRVRLATTPFAPVIAWTEGAVNDRRLKVAHGQGFSLLAPQVNAPFNVPVTITHFGMRPEDNGAIVMWTQDERPFSVFARRWDGSVWVDYGAPPVNVDTNLLLSFAMARRSVDVAFSLQPLGNAPFTSLFQRSGNQWFAPAALITPGAPLRNIEVEFPRTTEPIVAGTFANGAELFELRVYRYFP